MSSYVAAELRRLVAERAEHLCEYCLIHEDDTYFGCEIDHIISEKHGGPTVAENLALACVFCNRSKGTDIGSIVPATGEFRRFFDPRRDQWSDHFRLDDPGMEILALTAIGDVTTRILSFNHPDRILERRALGAVARYPSPEALARIHT